MRQLGGDEQKPKALKRAVQAALMDTQWACKVETNAQIARVLKHVQEDHADLISRAKKCTVDDRRWLWTTHSNLSTWYDGWKEFLLDAEFAEDKPEKLPGGRTAEITIPPQKLRRIMNSDETHHKLSNEGDRGGPRATTWVSRALGRSGKRKAAASGHATGLYTTTAGRQSGPAMFFFSSDAEKSENYKVQTSWLVGLPRVRYEIPNGQIVVMPSHVIVTPKGGMTGGAFEQWLEACVYPMFPDLAPDWECDEEGNVTPGSIVLKIDGGPGRLGKASHGWRKRAAVRGLYTFPGLQNATSVNQEINDLYGTFQQTCDDVTDDIVSERVAKRAREVRWWGLTYNLFAM